MNCQEHDNQSMDHCPSCLACYWEWQYRKAKTERDEMKALLKEVLKWLEELNNQGISNDDLYTDICDILRR